MKQYVVNAFSSRLFHGTPTAVCVLEEWPSSRWMGRIAKENNLAITAFLVREKDRYAIRYYTPNTQGELSGHATLAATFVILNFIESKASSVKFYAEEEKEEIYAFYKNSYYHMVFPTYPLEEIEVTDEMEKIFGVRPIQALLGLDLICVFDELKNDIKWINPDPKNLCKLPGRYQIITAYQRDMGLKKAGCFSRCFNPKEDRYEAPISGTAHCQIGAYWTQKLGEEEIVAYQSSYHHCIFCKPLENGRIQISGQAVLFSIAEIPEPCD